MASPAIDPQSEAELGERARDVAAALGSLPAEQREVIELAYFGGLSQTEIADRTSTPLGTVKTRARLALEKLRGPLWAHREAAT
jgi:RNA polymerase sigma-70 factor (ECF subfamily)